VADKARALTAALETHAREVGQILGQQAGELDEQLMHGVNAVRRASENVSKQSLKAIEGLAGQAEMLKNVSENLVGQISNVSSRFDQQNQTIMKAANALESANYRIDKTLQNRQHELTDTLEQLSRRTTEIDQVIRGYSTSIDGTFNEAEARARSVGDQIHRTAEERTRQIESELARLQTTAANETDRALSDLRSKYSNVTREVAEEIGSLSSRFNETSEDMRQRAQRTLSEIEVEQARLRDQLARLPEATRASTESLRQSLQEQIKALEQLSTLTTREAVRADVSPPLALPPAQASQPAPARSISSITQSLATEMASRNRAAEARRPAATPSAPAAASSPAPRPQPSAVASASAAALLSPLQAPVQGLPSAPARLSPPVAPASPAAPQARPSDPGAVAGADAGREGWKLGDLLARASQAEETPQGSPIDIQAIARSLDSTTASAIWSRFRAGQRGIMVRSIYTNEGRTAFDEVQRRYKADRPFQQTVDRFMADFENVLREADQRDPSGRTGQSYIVLESGRVYLFLAHASGRLS
jgi:F0F1-type ATP synthase membrane subunit b/b'